MSAEVVVLAKRRPPVRYSIELTHFWDGRMTFSVHGVGSDDRSRRAVAAPLRAAAAKLDPKSGLVAQSE